ncbi:hypothetical protein [Clostridium novyi]|uniref:Lipoprotein, putative n=1 Tax=Clostridium novyi (strain NT) TaxID=386415 RepID=A0Q3J7_CLONN|nr:hypothetical protein [Clostridium novyi]ABK62619.1 lipoprotein, putative [Clostridium novyi NT]KEH86593.1 hypothetical protein Z966_02440 [Clostridium novyi A str. NCTC 538]
MNKKFLVSILMIATIFSCIGLTGCKKTKPTTATPKQEQVQKQDKEQKQVKQEDSSKKIAESIKFETKDETACYRVFGEKNEKKVYYTMDMPEAKEVTKFVTTYLKAGDNVDYNTVKNDSQFPYYSKRLEQEYGGKEHCDKNNVNGVKEIKLIEKLIGFNGYNCIEFNKDFTACKVSVDRLILFKNFSKESKLAKSNVKLNTIYSNEATFNLIRENNEWKIDKEKVAKVFYPFQPNSSQN